MRQRHVGGVNSSSNVEEDIDTVLRHHNQMQDQLADEMVQLARNLKDNARLAGSIVKEDTHVSRNAPGLNHTRYYCFQ